MENLRSQNLLEVIFFPDRRTSGPFLLFAPKQGHRVWTWLLRRFFGSGCLFFSCWTCWKISWIIIEITAHDWEKIFSQKNFSSKFFSVKNRKKISGDHKNEKWAKQTFFFLSSSPGFFYDSAIKFDEYWSHEKKNWRKWKKIFVKNFCDRPSKN